MHIVFLSWCNLLIMPISYPLSHLWHQNQEESIWMEYWPDSISTFHIIIYISFTCETLSFSVYDKSGAQNGQVLCLKSAHKRCWWGCWSFRVGDLIPEGAIYTYSTPSLHSGLQSRFRKAQATWVCFAGCEVGRLRQSILHFFVFSLRFIWILLTILKATRSTNI